MFEEEERVGEREREIDFVHLAGTNFVDAMELGGLHAGGAASEVRGRELGELGEVHSGEAHVHVHRRHLCVHGLVSQLCYACQQQTNATLQTNTTLRLFV